MTAQEIIIWLRAKGISLWTINEELHFQAPDGVLTAAITERIKAHRIELIEELKNSDYAAYRRKVAHWPEAMRNDFWKMIERRRGEGEEVGAVLKDSFEMGEAYRAAMKRDGVPEADW